MDTHCQTAVMRESGECQNLGRSAPFKTKKVGGQGQTKDSIGAISCNMCLLSL